jgi:hypothetical protein
MHETDENEAQPDPPQDAAEEAAWVHSDYRPKQEERGISRDQWWLISLVLALTAGSLMYRILVRADLTHSAAMFLGIPAVLAILLGLTAKARTLTGGIVKGITLFLLIVAPLLGEGYLCILIASPIFYLVGIIVGLLADSQRNRRKATLSCVAIIFLPMCLEGIVPQLTLSRDQVVESAAVVNSPAAAVEAALAQSPSLQTSLPAWLNVGFPRPLAAYGSGLAVGAMRTIHFAGAEGDPPGDLVSRVAENRPNYVRMETVSDSTKLTQWVRWQSSEVEWREVDSQHTAVTWRVHFARQLDPAWYFIPWERFTVRQAARYMIDANATPRPAAR